MMLLPRLDARKLISLFLVGTLLLILSGSALPRIVCADPTTTLQIAPSDSTARFGTYFNVNVSVASVANLTCWEFKLYYLNTVVNCTGVTEGSFLKSTGGITAFKVHSLNNNYNSTHGCIWAYCITLHQGSQNVSGSGNLAEVAFAATGAGDTPLSLADTVLGDAEEPSEPIHHTIINGEVLVLPAGGPQPVAGVVGITGYKLVFKETMDNYLGSPVTIGYYWSFGVDKWNGAQWLPTTISGSSAPVVGYVIPGLTTVDLPYYVYLLPISGPNNVTWGDWLRINYTFHWTYSGTNYSTDYTAKLHVHPADIAGAASVTFPYLGADGNVATADLHVLGVQWGLSSAGVDPTSDLGRADINGDGNVGTADLHILGVEWGQTWTNTTPPG